MDEKEIIEYQMDILDQVLGQYKTDYATFSHACVRAIFEMLNEIPIGIQAMIFADLPHQSKKVIEMVQQVFIKYHELENYTIKEETNG